MADWFVDTTLATGSNDGTSTDDAWQSIETAMEYSGFSAGDKIWIRRVSNETGITSDIAVGDGGNLANPLMFLGWPRNTQTGTIDFVNGSNVLDGASITPDFERHCARRIKNDTNGDWYFITALAHKIDYDNESGTFTEGLMVTGGSSGATGKILKVVDNGTTGTLYVVLQGTTTFTNNEQITDTDTGVADVNGASSDDGFIIDRNYAGSNDSAANFTIEVDDHYTEAQAIDDSAWTIKLSTWDSDNDDLPIIDFEGNSYSLYLHTTAVFTQFKNLRIIDSSDSNGSVWFRSSVSCLFKNCIFETDQNTNIFVAYSGNNFGYIEKCVFRGSNSGSGQLAIEIFNGKISLDTVAIYGFGDVGVYCNAGYLSLNNVNIGVELNNSDDDILLHGTAPVCGHDVKLGGVNGDVSISTGALNPQGKIKIYNYGKILNAYKEWYTNGTIEFNSVVVGSGDPEGRAGGADFVLSISPQSNSNYAGIDEWSYIINELKIWADTSSKSYRFYVQCDAISTSSASELLLEVEYLSTHDDEDEYQYMKEESDETCSLRTGADDWTQYIEVTGIQPAADGWLYLRLKISKYDSDGTIHIDSQVVVS